MLPRAKTRNKFVHIVGVAQTNDRRGIQRFPKRSFNRDRNVHHLPLSLQIAQLHSALKIQAEEISSRHGTLNLAQWCIIRLVALDIADTTKSAPKTAGIDKNPFSEMLSVLIERG